MEVSRRRFLPDDVLEQILVRLPVKHLLVLKCVCKHWNALIHDYAFINKHYHFQLHAALHGDIPLFLYHPYPGDDNFEITEFYLLSKKQGVDSVFNLTPHFERDALTSNFLTYQRLPSLMLHCTGVVNGVIGLQWGGRNSSRCNSMALVLGLWNPATREFRDVPQWPVKLETCVISQILGLGFDVQSNDIKIMGLVTFIDNDVNPNCYKKECYLYSLKRNSWKKIKEHPSLNLDIEYSEADACLNNGVYYWLGHDHSEWENTVILSFNFSTESFRESDLELPECPECGSSQQMRDDGRRVYCCNSRYYSKTQIGKYKEGLAIYDIRTLENKDSVIRIWVTTEFSDDGVPFSWQALLTVGPIKSYCGLWMLTYRLSGDLLLMLQHENILEIVEPWGTLRSEMVQELGCLYDPCTSTLTFLELGCGSSFSYVESLFSLSDKNN